MCLKPCAIYFGILPGLASPLGVSRERGGAHSGPPCIGYSQSWVLPAIRRVARARKWRQPRCPGTWHHLLCCTAVPSGHRPSGGLPISQLERPMALPRYPLQEANVNQILQRWEALCRGSPPRVGHLLQSSVRAAVGAGARPPGCRPQRADRGPRAAALHHVLSNVAHLPRRLPGCEALV